MVSVAEYPEKIIFCNRVLHQANQSNEPFHTLPAFVRLYR